MQRILSELPQLPHKFSRFTPSSPLLVDLRWWNEFLTVYNGVSFYAPFFGSIRLSVFALTPAFFRRPFLPLVLSNFHRQGVTVHRFAQNVGCHR